MSACLRMYGITVVWLLYAEATGQRTACELHSCVLFVAKHQGAIQLDMYTLVVV